MKAQILIVAALLSGCSDTASDAAHAINFEGFSLARATVIAIQKCAAADALESGSDYDCRDAPGTSPQRNEARRAIEKVYAHRDAFLKACTPAFDARSCKQLANAAMTNGDYRPIPE